MQTVRIVLPIFSSLVRLRWPAPSHQLFQRRAARHCPSTVTHSASAAAGPSDGFFWLSDLGYGCLVLTGQSVGLLSSKHAVATYRSVIIIIPHLSDGASIPQLSDGASKYACAPVSGASIRSTTSPPPPRQGQYRLLIHCIYSINFFVLTSPAYLPLL